MKAPLSVCVAGTGFWAPPTVQTAADLAPLVGRSEAWIRSRTGVHERRISDESMAQMAARAGRRAIGDGPPPDLVINASLTPMQLAPDSSVFVMRELGLDGIPSFSVHGSCLSFLVGLQQASALISVGAARRVLVVSAEQASLCRNMSEPESAVLLGDGAGAVLMTETPSGGESALLDLTMRTFPDGAELAEIRGFGSRHHPNRAGVEARDNLFFMNGPRIYRAAIPRVHKLVQDVLGAHKLTPEGVDWLVPHQASGPALAALPRLGFATDRIVDVVGEYGNCVAASMPMALARAAQDGRIQRGDTVMLLGTGAGLSVGAALLRW